MVQTIKILFVLLFVLIASACGGAYSSNAIYEKVNAECPRICYKDGQMWSGLIKAYPASIDCLCVEKK